MMFCLSVLVKLLRRDVHNYFFWIGLIKMFAFWVFMQFGQELKLKSFEHELVEDLSEALGVWRGVCVDFFVV